MILRRVRKALPAAGLALLLAGVCCPAAAQPASTVERAARLVEELQCPACHAGVGAQRAENSFAPDLGFAGRQFNAAYLFHYLRKPVPVRRGIGRAVMPDFGFDPEESLALTLFLAAQEQLPRAWPQSTAAAMDPRAGALPPVDAVATLQGAGCLACHRYRDAGADRALDLGMVGVRLSRPWVASFLVDPSRLDPDVAMPGLFHRFDARTQRYEALTPASSSLLAAVTQTLFDAATQDRQGMETAYRDARARYPDIDAAFGERIFRAQNCGACHGIAGESIGVKHPAPDLGSEGSRVRREWLATYLRHPTAIRPAGYPPGSGARMPDFNLPEQDAQLLADMLMGNARAAGVRDPAAPLSRFATGKAARLLDQKLPCQGCHRIGERGGMLGPDLALSSSRLQPAYVFAMIADPQSMVPGTIMPRARLPDSRLDLVARFLVHGKLTRAPGGYLPLKDVLGSGEPASREHGADLYRRYCSDCHGSAGHADGVNARFLPTPPAVLADGSRMARRPDDTLHDGIFAGGAILGQDHRMPAWGHTLSSADIRALVEHIRHLCQCREPAWSSDNESGAP